IAGSFSNRGYKPAKNINNADVVIINTCVVRESAENRVYGLLEKLKNSKNKIVLTGCLVGMATRDSSGKLMQRLKEKFPMVDEFLHIEEIGFDPPLRGEASIAIVPISNGCNNCCTYCVVPFTRGREVSRPYDDVINECKGLKNKNVLLVGQNVNSYGADFAGSDLAMHMGRQRYSTLFPQLLEDVAKMGFGSVSFISSNPWDFSDELIEVIKRNKNITRDIHLPVQSGDDEILKRMNRWYTANQYLELVGKIKKQIPSVQFSTDIIVGFPGETEEQFNNTVDLCKTVGFFKAYVSEYSDRQITAAHKIFKDDIMPVEKKRRWLILDNLINKKT
ncbi:MAG: MiaB/RimO family radical SAM methylthiotransferase, partial [bacterium]|nr:MiaB/RimO family radical SAM methylthiotransferase [bacterium]